ncbi:hypothetical protein QQ045_029340 [Rhodiola kirilowii]
MGNHKFRLSDMMPNAWFYKLKDMSKRTTTTNNSSAATAASHYSNHHNHNKKKQQSTTTNPQKPRQPPASSRKSYYFTRDSTPIDSLSHSKSSSIDSLFPDPIITKPRSDFAPPPSPSMEMRSDRALPTESFEEKVSWSPSCNDYEPRNIVIDIDETKQLAAKIENSDDFVTIFDLELRPILTKPRKLKVKHQQERNPEFQTVSNKIRTSSPGGVKLRVNSPRISSKRFTTVNGARRSMTSSSSSSSSSKNKNKKKNALAESLAIVKRSENPQEDFKQSMVEMIVEHQIRSTNDLEELLACYLSLNSDEYHDIIISVFKQIWFQLSGLNKNNNGAN